MYVYILQSKSYPDRYYTGLTKDLEQRLKKHNAGDVSHSSKYRPWEIKNYFWFNCETKARDFEKYLKSGSGRAFLKRHF